MSTAPTRLYIPAATRVPLNQDSTLLRRVADAAPDAMVVLDSTGHIQFANTAATKLFDRAELELLHTSLAPLIAHEQRTSLADSFADYLSAPYTIPAEPGLEWRLLRRSGEEIKVRAGITPTRAGGKLLVIVTLRL